MNDFSGISSDSRNKYTASQRKLAIVAVCIIPCIVLVLLREVGVISTRKVEVEVLGFDWNFDEILAYIDAPYPDGATAIEYDSNHFDRTFFIKLSFKAPPNSAMKFAESICNGVLYRNYNPFNTIDTSQPLPNSVLIITLGGGYYSQSPSAIPTQLGNRCDLFKSNSNGYYIRRLYILVDTSNPNLYGVRLEIPENERLYISTPYDPSPSAEIITPMNNFPFAMIGLTRSIGNEFYLFTTGTVCFETRYDGTIYGKYNGQVYGTSDGKPPPGSYPGLYPPELIGSVVTIAIDGTIVVDTTISERWTLLHPKQKDVDFDVLFNYCVYQAWSEGTHQISLHITQPDGSTRDWVFIAENHPSD